LSSRKLGFLVVVYIHINAKKLAEFFVEKVSGMHATTTAIISSATCKKFSLRKCS